MHHVIKMERYMQLLVRHLRRIVSVSERIYLYTI